MVRSGIRDMEVLVTPNQVQFLAGVADNFIRKVLIGQKHTQLVPQWYGETVGFWDDETLIAWTANVQGWTITPFDDRVQQLARGHRDHPPREDGEGLVVEADVLRPRSVRAAVAHRDAVDRTGGIDDPDRRYKFVECRVENGIVLGPDGRPSQLTPFDEGYIDFFGRPWAQNWEKFFEQGWEHPPE